MGIIIAFFCGLCFYTLSNSIANYIEAAAKKLEAQAVCMKVDAKWREFQLEKRKESNFYGNI